MDFRGLVACKGKQVVTCRISPQSIHRVGQFLHDLCKLAKERGLDLMEGEISARLVMDCHAVDLAISERVNRKIHIITPQERDSKAVWFRDHPHHSPDRRHRRTFASEGSAISDYDFAPSGMLSIRLTAARLSEAFQPFRVFRDGPRQKLENILPQIVSAIAELSDSAAEIVRGPEGLGHQVAAMAPDMTFAEQPAPDPEPDPAIDLGLEVLRINGQQCRMARAGLNCSVQALSRLARVKPHTIYRFETGQEIEFANRKRIIEALMGEGARFDREIGCVGVTVPLPKVGEFLSSE